jgi:hypothetical protein
MRDALELIFFGALACSTTVATAVMLFNFPRMRAAQRATMQQLEALGEAERVREQLRKYDVEAINLRLRALEDERTHG